MKLWRRLTCLLSGRHHPCPNCQVRLQLTGEPPRSASERLIKELAGDRKAVPLHWLEEQVSNALYDEELRRGAWVLDMGLWGPALFRKETTRIIAAIRPEFGHFIEESKPSLDEHVS